MSQTITRMYDSEERANQAAQDLRTDRFVHFDDVHVFSRQAGGADAIVAAMMKANVLKAHARVYAEGLQQGGGLVVVHAPFGCAMQAIDILEGHGPVASGVPGFRDDLMPWDDAAPCSSALHVRVLLDDAHTFSRFWNVPPLLKGGATTSSALGWAEVTRSRGPFSGTFGMPMISHKATWLSSMLGLPVLLGARKAR